MELCQHCGIYMKPIIVQVTERDFVAKCEFCGKVIAEASIGVKWVKTEPKPKKETT
jgi:hypothetical protein